MKAQLRKTNPVPTLKPATKFKSCSDTHAEIRYQGACCPLCARGKQLDNADAWVNRLADLLAKQEPIVSRLNAIDTHISSVLHDYGLKLIALDEAIAMLVSGSEPQCEACSPMLSLGGRMIQPHRCVLRAGHVGEHVYSLKRPASDPTSLSN